MSASNGTDSALGTMEPSLNGWNPDYVEKLYEVFRRNPGELDERWQAFFQGFELALSKESRGGPRLRPVPAEEHTFSEGELSGWEMLQSQVDSLIYHYRDIGHFKAKIDPLGHSRGFDHLLDLANFGISERDLDESFWAHRIAIGPDRMKLREILGVLEATYCRSIGVEYMDIQDTRQRRWLQKRMEECLNKPTYSRERKKRIALMLRRAGAFETFLHANYVGQKRFSLEGAETLIPLLDALIEKAPTLGISDIVMGMAHRGRLNVLANVLHKSYEMIFSEFEDNYEPGMIMGDGDVKYHKGYSSNWITTQGHEVHLTLTANPSHLEAVDPVVIGRVRAKQRQLGDKERVKATGILVHGDAAFAGQGIVAEVLNLSQLKGYTTGGTIHVIVNNQIGFTTDPENARSGEYCTDIAKMIQAPIFHVNGDDPEAVVHCAEMAMEFRQEFKKDVVIDMYCYRRHGHNEGDEPSFTQPKLYEKIRNHPTPFEVYAKQLLSEGSITQEELDRMARELDDTLADAQSRAKNVKSQMYMRPFGSKEWADFQPNYSHEPVDTSVPADKLRTVGEIWGRFPDGFTPNRKVVRILEQRRKTVLDGKGIDWATAEGLAFGTLLMEGTPVRLSGQDSRRGTFSQRHAAVLDVQTNEFYLPLSAVSPDQATFCVYDSPLSEAAVLGFDYGYSLAEPEMLICWEAQFGDFANGAQTIIDQFLVSGESKWGRYSGLVLLLPHGYEGQGPEHSSGWLERFLQLCAEDNIQVANVTTPAQYFHLLRRQMKRNFRKPLVIMTPKSLLRHPMAVSDLEDMSGGSFFREVLDDEAVNAEKVRRVIMCSGKVYYELLERVRQEETDEIALVRVEQLYPFPKDQLAGILGRYSNASEFIWCQEETENRGAWTFMSDIVRQELGIELGYAGRERAASPAVGSLKMHKAEQDELLSAATHMRSPITSESSVRIPRMSFAVPGK
jgi:2-oxoglutarate dehydrogenase E1 component